MMTLALDHIKFTNHT